MIYFIHSIEKSTGNGEKHLLPKNIPQVVFMLWADNFLQVYSIFSTPLLSMYKWTIKLQYEAKTGLFSVNSVIAQWEFMELDIELLHTIIIKKFNPEVFWLLF